ncbi:FumA C-terminus/TtdB family hydratase beta subunit [Metallosphaera hakonensis]|uniref:Fe-S hydro-lyase subunit beta n=1 Tax=Metallosphaera hakonensis JCM 8857 = DSM 7519 TaxID=1293036 RepID=A0A2U9IXD8_9CREN|nr:FumA C-terminus/TtdB family hydratase beta subunit [Metallosphaera hakonensis]AWS00735.1 Fe-S hydro-lyase subunit beta [Metallosphaera hakonensis JCM 8857 = DSM 7519]
MKELVTPLGEETAESLLLGEEVYLSGKIYIMRDATLRRIFEEGATLPVTLKDQVIFFGAPSFVKENDEYRILSVGVTTSQRMEKYIPRLLRELGVRAIIGKGELSEKMNQEFSGSRSVYLLFVGGAAALATSSIQRVNKVWWEDLKGEALFEVEMKSLGPAFVAIDVNGNNLLLNNRNKVLENLRSIMKEEE